MWVSFLAIDPLLEHWQNQILEHMKTIVGPRLWCHQGKCQLQKPFIQIWLMLKTALLMKTPHFYQIITVLQSLTQTLTPT